MPISLNRQLDQMLSSGIAALAAAGQPPPQTDPGTAALAGRTAASIAAACATRQLLSHARAARSR
jgi:hypothetical protein